MSTLARSRTEQASAHVDRSATAAAERFISENLSQRITLRCLERATGLDPFQLIRAFRRALGTTPHAYLIEARVSRAAELLARGEPAAEIASEVGFVDQSHLIRHFKRIYGQTPRQYVQSAC